MPSPTKSINFLYAGIPLDYRAAQTRRALSKLKANYHLFLRNQPRKPELMMHPECGVGGFRGRQGRVWKAPVVRL